MNTLSKRAKSHFKRAAWPTQRLIDSLCRNLKDERARTYRFTPSFILLKLLWKYWIGLQRSVAALRWWYRTLTRRFNGLFLENPSWQRLRPPWTYDGPTALKNCFYFQYFQAPKTRLYIALSVRPSVCSVLFVAWLNIICMLFVTNNITLNPLLNHKDENFKILTGV